MKRLAVIIVTCFVVVMASTWTAGAYGVNGDPIPEVLVDLELNTPIPTAGLLPAVRIDPPDPPPPPPPTGLWGQPFAPADWHGCLEMSFYRQQWGLPAAFQDIGWRESNCRNEDGVRTSCCHGYWQLWTSLHLQDHRLVTPMHNCGVWSHYDLNSDVPIEKQRQACAAKALFDVVGYSAW